MHFAVKECGSSHKTEPRARCSRRLSQTGPCPARKESTAAGFSGAPPDLDCSHSEHAYRTRASSSPGPPGLREWVLCVSRVEATACLQRRGGNGEAGLFLISSHHTEVRFPGTSSDNAKPRSWRPSCLLPTHSQISLSGSTSPLLNGCCWESVWSPDPLAIPNCMDHFIEIVIGPSWVPSSKDV